MKYAIFSQLILLIAFKAWAQGSPGVTYQGRLMKPDGDPVTASSVQFRVQIRTGDPSYCVMYEETQVKDLSQSSGTFAITLNDGTATQPNTEPYTLTEVFRNIGSITFPPGKCTGTNVATFLPTSSRHLSVSFNDGTFSGWEPLPGQKINFVPMAFEAMQIQGRTASNFFRVETGSVPEIMGAWSVASYTKLTDLIANTTISGGNASIGGNSAGFTGSLTGDVTGGQSSTKVEKIQGRNVFDMAPTNGQVLTWNNAQTRWEPANPAGGTETDPTVEAFAQNPPSADFTTPSGVLTLATVPVSKGGTGATTASGARTNLGLGTAATKDFGSSAGNLVELDGSGKIPAALLPASGGSYFVQGGNAFAAPAVLGTTDAQPLHLQTGGTNKVTILNNGNVGIGTATPTEKFAVSDGNIMASGTFGAGPVLGNPAVGSHLIWYPRKAAFRVGRVTGTTWNEANIGDHSLALGSETSAPHLRAVAIGHAAVATGGNDPLAIGSSAYANSGGAMAVGLLSRADGTQSTALGAFSTTGVFQETVIGPYNVVSSGNVGTWVATDPLFVIGNGTSSSIRSNAMTILKNGNVGIGVLAPQSKLDVAGTMRVNEICDENGGNCKDLSSGWGGGGDIDGIVTNSGSGLTGGTGSGTATLSLVTDGSTVEVSGTNQLRLKDSGITTAKIGNLQVTDEKIAGVAVSKITSGSGLYLTYAPNNNPCSDGDVLKKTANGWECGTDNSGAASPLTTKGDLYIRNATVDTRLPAGADGKVLKADSSQGEGLIWGDAIATDISSLATTGIVQRTGAGSYSTLGVSSPLSIVGSNIVLGQGENGVVLDGGNTVTSALEIGTNSAHTLAFETDSTTRMKILNNGNIGIGVDPLFKFHLESNDNVSAGEHIVALMRRDTNGGGFVLGYEANGSAVTASRIRGSGNFDLRIGTNSQHDTLSITDGGRVGIGTTNPSAVLSVQRNSDAENGIEVINTSTGSSAVASYYMRNGTGSAQFGITSTGHTWGGNIARNRAFLYADAASDGVAVITDSTDPIILGTNSTERMRVSGSGNVGIGTTNPTSHLEVSTAGNTELKVVSTGGANYPNVKVQNFGTGVPEVLLMNSNGTQGSPTETAGWDWLGTVGFVGRKPAGVASDTTGIGNAGILAEAEATFTNASHPTRLSFYTTPSASTASVARMSIGANGNVGIGTTMPQSALQVTGYVQLDTVAGSPPAGDCDAAAEYGRMKADPTNNKLYVCTASGWTEFVVAGAVGPTSCPAGFTMIGNPGLPSTYCIDTTERTAATFLAAKAACYGVSTTRGVASICSNDQWYRACLAGTPTSMTGNNEWASDEHYNVAGDHYAVVMGGSNCSTVTDSEIINTRTYRCCVK